MTRPLTAATADCGAVLVHFYAPDEGRATLTSLLAQGLPEEQICVVNNGAQSGFAERLLARFPGVHIIGLENPGYGVAANVGIDWLRRRGFAKALLATHEVVFLHGRLTDLVAGVVPGRVPIVGPLVAWKGKDCIVWSAGGKVTRLRQLAFNRGKGRPIETYFGHPPFNVDWVEGCCFVVDIDFFTRLGGFDERYFLYMEEVELAWRVRKGGRAVVLDPRVVVAQSPGNLPRTLAVRNRTLLLFTHGSRVARAFWLAENLSALLVGLRRPRGYAKRVRERVVSFRTGRRLATASKATY